MTATENVLVGLHHTFRSNVLDVMLHTPRYRREERRGLVQRADRRTESVFVARPRHAFGKCIKQGDS